MSAPLFKPLVALVPYHRSAESWHEGDIAECIASSGWRSLDGQSVDGPVKGERYVVRKVGTWDATRPIELLAFREWPEMAWEACAFRKVRPTADAPIPADATFIAEVRFAIEPLEKELAA